MKEGEGEGVKRDLEVDESWRVQCGNIWISYLKALNSIHHCQRRQSIQLAVIAWQQRAMRCTVRK